MESELLQDLSNAFDIKAILTAALGRHQPAAHHLAPSCGMCCHGLREILLICPLRLTGVGYLPPGGW